MKGTLQALLLGIAALAPLVALVPAQAEPPLPHREMPIEPLRGKRITPTPVAVPNVQFTDPGPAIAARVLAQPDLTVQRERLNEAGQDQFTVINHGPGDTGGFRIAVLAGAQSFSVHLFGLPAGQRATYPIPDLECRQAVSIIADIDSRVAERDEQNNSTQFYAGCRIDNGTGLNPVGG